ncbi:MAG TPA: hypothetical protein PKX92_12600 [Edaphocola sp.]|nr:hypothetical protein [Edaphocola sp.]
MEFISINDELQSLKKELIRLGFINIKVEKVGNGNMAAFKVMYQRAAGAPIENNYFWRHDMDKFIESLQSK